MKSIHQNMKCRQIDIKIKHKLPENNSKMIITWWIFFHQLFFEINIRIFYLHCIIVFYYWNFGPKFARKKSLYGEKKFGYGYVPGCLRQCPGTAGMFGGSWWGHPGYRHSYWEGWANNGQYMAGNDRKTLFLKLIWYFNVGNMFNTIHKHLTSARDHKINWNICALRGEEILLFFYDIPKTTTTEYSAQASPGSCPPCKTFKIIIY